MSVAHGGRTHIRVPVSIRPITLTASASAKPSLEPLFLAANEIQDYLSDKADEFNIRPHIRFGVEVKQVDWQDDEGHWLLQIEGADGKETLAAPILVSAVGQIS